LRLEFLKSLDSNRILEHKTFRGTVSKALLISMAATRDLRAGLPCFRPSRVDWVRDVSRVGEEGNGGVRTRAGLD